MYLDFNLKVFIYKDANVAPTVPSGGGEYTGGIGMDTVGGIK